MSIETRLSERLRQRVTELRQDAVNTVLGFRLQDFSEYRFSAGYTKALDDVLTVMGEILEDIEKG